MLKRYRALRFAQGGLDDRLLGDRSDVGARGVGLRLCLHVVRLRLVSTGRRRQGNVILVESHETAGVRSAWRTSRRTARLMGLPAGALRDSVRAAARRAAGAPAEVVRREQREAAAERTRRILGEMKGGALKAGQLLSTVEMLFPPDPEQTWRDTLTSLQEDVPPLPFSEAEPVLLDQLGMGWRDLFTSFDDDAVAAASLGQVHRAVWADGRSVAVKVQYPGVADAMAADLRALSVVSSGIARLAPAISLPPLVAELRTRLLAELDYVHEGATQQRFAAAYAEDTEVFVPSVVLARPRVLVSEWLEGVPLARVARDGDQLTRDRLAVRYQRFMLGAPARLGVLHTDPHPGNFRLLPDGRLGVIDFGSSLELPGGLPRSFGTLIRALMSGGPTEVTKSLRGAGLVDPDKEIDTAALMDYLAPFTEPARHETFHYTRDWLRSQFSRVNDPRNPDFAVALQLRIPPEHLFTHRVWLGVTGVLAQLEARVPVRSELDALLPGFAGAQA
jgi:predicted unusual protein kinase regulating ubiquinone biosynthesis (AarF/ABC1/UbiB family)